MPDASPTAERRQSLWLLTVAPVIWAAHFLFAYVTAAIWCARVADTSGGLGPVRLAVAIATLVALTGIGIVGVIAYRRHDYGFARIPHDFDTADDRHRFLGFAMLLLSGLSAVAVSYTAVVVLFFETCA